MKNDIFLLRDRILIRSKVHRMHYSKFPGTYQGRKVRYEIKGAKICGGLINVVLELKGIIMNEISESGVLGYRCGVKSATQHHPVMRCPGRWERLKRS